MNTVSILEEVLDRKAREIAREILFNISADYMTKANFKSPNQNFKNRRLSKKWYSSMACSIRFKAKKLQ